MKLTLRSSTEQSRIRNTVKKKFKSFRTILWRQMKWKIRLFKSKVKNRKIVVKQHPTQKGSFRGISFMTPKVITHKSFSMQISFKPVLQGWQLEGNQNCKSYNQKNNHRQINLGPKHLQQVTKQTLRFRMHIQSQHLSKRRFRQTNNLQQMCDGITQTDSENDNDSKHIQQTSSSQLNKSQKMNLSHTSNFLKRIEKIPDIKLCEKRMSDMSLSEQFQSKSVQKQTPKQSSKYTLHLSHSKILTQITSQNIKLINPKDLLSNPDFQNSPTYKNNTNNFMSSQTPKIFSVVNLNYQPDKYLSQDLLTKTQDLSEQFQNLKYQQRNSNLSRTQVVNINDNNFGNQKFQSVAELNQSSNNKSGSNFQNLLTKNTKSNNRVNLQYANKTIQRMKMKKLRKLAEQMLLDYNQRNENHLSPDYKSYRNSQNIKFDRDDRISGQIDGNVRYDKNRRILQIQNGISSPSNIDALSPTSKRLLKLKEITKHFNDHEEQIKQRDFSQEL
eukprot:403363993